MIEERRIITVIIGGAVQTGENSQSVTAEFCQGFKAALILSDITIQESLLGLKIKCVIQERRY
jgi:hypothetical protein